MKTLTVLILLTLTLPAQAHTLHDLDEWYADWRGQVAEQGPIPEPVVDALLVAGSNE